MWKDESIILYLPFSWEKWKTSNASLSIVLGGIQSSTTLGQKPFYQTVENGKLDQRSFNQKDENSILGKKPFNQMLTIANKVKPI
jgi:hypothetical protein